jgi:hypothetical protein
MLCVVHVMQLCIDAQAQPLPTSSLCLRSMFLIHLLAWPCEQQQQQQCVKVRKITALWACCGPRVQGMETSLRILSCSIMATWNLVFSMQKLQPCIAAPPTWGSMNRGQRLALDTMMPLSMENESLGSPSITQSRMRTGSPSTVTSLKGRVNAATQSGHQGCCTGGNMEATLRIEKGSCINLMGCKQNIDCHRRSEHAGDPWCNCCTLVYLPPLLSAYLNVSEQGILASLHMDTHLADACTHTGHQ